MRLSIVTLTAALLIATALPVAAQKKYSGPRPEKSDVPFLQHGKKLIEVETSEARRCTGQRRDELHRTGSELDHQDAGAGAGLSVSVGQDQPGEAVAVSNGGQGRPSAPWTLPTDPRRRKDKARPLFILVSPIGKTGCSRWR